ncbi:MAG: rhomboid family intramembrane serine protease [Steroidobacter sp.]
MPKRLLKTFDVLTPITCVLLFGNTLMFVFQESVAHPLLSTLALQPFDSRQFRDWQLFTYAFVHVDWAHLIVNMGGLCFFGPAIERQLGGRRFLIYFVLCLLGAALTHLTVSRVNPDISVPIAGSSGGLFGLVFAYGWLFPHQPIMLNSRVKNWLFVGFFALVELLIGVFKTKQGVAHFAHLGGMLAGFLLLLFWRTQARNKL